MKTIIPAFAAMLLSSTMALAHSDLTASFPADGTWIDPSVTKLAMTFGKEIRLVTVTIGPEGGDATTLDLDEQNSLSTEFELALPALETGPYTIEWRGLGEDGHVMTGQIRFAVK